MENDYLESKLLEEKLEKLISNLDAIDYSIEQNYDFEYIKHLAVLAKFENEKFVELSNFLEANKWANYALILHNFLLRNVPEIDWYPDILLIGMRTIQNFQDLNSIEKIEALINDFIQRLPYNLDDALKKIEIWKTLDISDILQLRRIKNSLRIFSIFLDEDYLLHCKHGQTLLNWLKIRNQLP